MSSLEGHGAPTIDIGLECVGSGLKQVVGILANMVPFRRRTNQHWVQLPLAPSDGATGSTSPF
jgi:hypothetical protein